MEADMQDSVYWDRLPVVELIEWLKADETLWAFEISQALAALTRRGIKVTCGRITNDDAPDFSLR